MDNLWDQKLNNICEQFFNQAKDSLFNKTEKPNIFQGFPNAPKNAQMTPKNVQMSVSKFNTGKIQ